VSHDKWPTYSSFDKYMVCITHGGYFIMLLFDFTYNAIIFKKRNLFWIAFIGSLYGVCNFVITVTTGKPVYAVMDFKSITSYIFIMAAVFGMLIMFTAGWILHLYFKAPLLEVNLERETEKGFYKVKEKETEN